MTEDEQQAKLDRVARDAVTVAREDVRMAFAQLLRWPWSKKRQATLASAFDRMLDVFVNRVEGIAGHVVAGPYEGLAARIEALEEQQTREVGGG